MIQFGLNENIIVQIRNVIETFPQIEKVILYGSRAKGTYRNGSDIDLTLKGEGLNQSVLFKIEDELDDLMLPYTFDISVFDLVSDPDFRQHVERVGKVFYQKVS